ncbi:MAG TPA: GNAT family N-acetyltransferase [Caldisericia bacterium]|nr:GNAT family N-acetyltransferase [Caldisericia bacterium]HPI83461.1 GNAT family N-acetyltransferase [Caldisericia bacterium]HPQ92813.1 GNAT family N-acetyltransferase [Caldisericia bacterium]HRV74089.1 GNAT family N-acetyltransferase [Caldisericia bacterium]
MRVIVRETTAFDVDDICALANDYYRYIESKRSVFVGSVCELKSLKGRYLELIGQINPEIFTATDEDGKFLGYIIVSNVHEPKSLTSVPHARVEEIAVSQEARGSGVAKELIRHAIEWARSKNLGVIQVTLWEGSEEAMKLFSGLDFVSIQRKLEKKIDLPDPD